MFYKSPTFGSVSSWKYIPWKLHDFFGLLCPWNYLQQFRNYLAMTALEKIRDIWKKILGRISQYLAFFSLQKMSLDWSHKTGSNIALSTCFPTFHSLCLLYYNKKFKFIFIFQFLQPILFTCLSVWVNQ